MGLAPLTHEAIRETLLEKVGREWPQGTRLPPIKQLARSMGLGQSSTHQAIKQLVAQGVLQTRTGRGTFVADTGRSAPARGAAASLRGKSVTVLHHRQVDGFFGPVREALRQELEGHGVAAAFHEFDLKPGERPALPQAPDALVVMNPFTNIPLEPAARQALLLIDTGLDYNIPTHRRYDIVSLDSAQGGYLLGCHAREIGIESACFIGCPARSGSGGYDLTSASRLSGFEHGWGRAVPPGSQLTSHDYMIVKGAAAAGDYVRLDPRPRFVFAASDDIALGLIYGALAHGLAPGRDYLLAGFDGQPRGRTVHGGPLTTIDAPLRDMGRVAARMLVERLAEPELPARRVFLGGALFSGATTGAGGGREI